MRIGFAVSEVSLVVIKRFFAYRNAEYECQGCNIRCNGTWLHVVKLGNIVQDTVSLTDLQRRNKLRQSHQQEVQIEEILELLIEYDRQEGDNVVLLIPNNICGKSFLHFVCREVIWA